MQARCFRSRDYLPSSFHNWPLISVNTSATYWSLSLLVLALNFILLLLLPPLLPPPVVASPQR